MKKFQLRNILSDWMEIRQTDTAWRWRGQLLSLVLLGSFHVALFLFVYNTVEWIRSPNPLPLRFFYANAAGIFAIVGMWWINRRGWNRTASVAFILLASFLPFLSVPAADFDRTLIGSAISITLASFLFTPTASFVVMALQTALYSIIYLQYENPLPYNYYSIIVMGLMAFISWICATWFEAALLQANTLQDRLRMITENMAGVIGHINTHSILLYASPSVKKMFGWEPKELEGRSVLEKIHPEESEGVLKKVQAAVAQHLPAIHLEFRYRCADGEYKWIESETRLMYEPSGTFDSAIFGIRDVSRRRQAEEALIRERTFLRAVIDASPNLICVRKSDGTFALANKCPGGRVRIHAGIPDRPGGFRVAASTGGDREAPRIRPRGHFARDNGHHPRGKNHPRRFGRALVQRHQNPAAGWKRRLRSGAVHFNGYHRAEKSGGGNPPSERRVGTPGGGTDRAAGNGEQGTGGVRLFRFPRSARPAAQHRRIRPGAAGGLRRPSGRSGPGLSAADPLRQQTHGTPDRRPAGTFAADPRRTAPPAAGSDRHGAPRGGRIPTRRTRPERGMDGGRKIIRRGG